MLRKGQQQTPEDVMTPEEEIKDPFFFEFLNLKDEYSESDLEGALIAKLETFLLELGGDFTFVGRQRRLRVGDAWYRIDLLFFRQRLFQRHALSGMGHRTVSRDIHPIAVEGPAPRDAQPPHSPEGPGIEPEHRVRVAPKLTEECLSRSTLMTSRTCGRD
jgi:hypothetical protein